MKHKRPECGIVGWAAAWDLLDRMEHTSQRETLGQLVREAGIRGAPAMKHMAATLMYLAGVGPIVPPSRALKAREVEWIEARAKELFAPHKGSFPKARRG